MEGLSLPHKMMGKWREQVRQEEGTEPAMPGKEWREESRQGIRRREAEEEKERHQKRCYIAIPQQYVNFRALQGL
eukprot:766577-Hanusia_phi.AAC.3